jgi:hypothetical protein
MFKGDRNSIHLTTATICYWGGYIQYNMSDGESDGISLTSYRCEHQVILIYSSIKYILGQESCVLGG